MNSSTFCRGRLHVMMGGLTTTEFTVDFTAHKNRCHRHTVRQTHRDYHCHRYTNRLTDSPGRLRLIMDALTTTGISVHSSAVSIGQTDRQTARVVDGLTVTTTR